MPYPARPYISPRTRVVHNWNESVLPRLKCRAIKDVIHAKFEFRDLRPTCGQMLKDRNVNIEAVSKVLRHRTTKTTELLLLPPEGRQGVRGGREAWE